MQKLIDLSAEDAKAQFLKSSSYFNGDFPNYIDFDALLKVVAEEMNGNTYNDFQSQNLRPEHFNDVNYSFVANKDGRYAWRPYELMNPVIYVSLVNLICQVENWERLKQRFKAFGEGIVECCSLPVLSTDHNTDQATQVLSWWKSVEQRSLISSLEFTHVLHTDVTDCYGSLYTHSIAWAVHGIDAAKAGRRKKSLLGNKIDRHMQASRFGQTNGISQGSGLMDFVAELVLGYVDELITAKLPSAADFKIIRYRDDYRIFTHNDHRAEEILKVVSDCLRTVGMKLNVSKTYACTNVVEGSIKEDKLAGLELDDLTDANAKTLQKQLLRLHTFGRRYPNSGALRRLMGDLHEKIVKQRDKPEDLEVQIAILTDIAVVSPLTFPAVAGTLSHLIALVGQNDKERLWSMVQQKMARVPYNGYLEVWLQRVTKPHAHQFTFSSNEVLCQIVDGADVQLWNTDWLAGSTLKAAVQDTSILKKDPEVLPEVVAPQEIALFKRNAWMY